MYVKSLSLINFRNYEKEYIEFSPYTNIICGNNAQGKTNLLEAVYIFAQGKSYRAKSDKELIKFGKDTAELKISFDARFRSCEASIKLQQKEKRKIRVNDVPIAKLSMLMNYLNTVMFSPEDLDLVKGSPAVRRKFLDLAISQLMPNYLSSLILYYKTLEQKNSLLKALKGSGRKCDQSLSAWNEQLCEAGADILKYRRDFLRNLSVFAKKIHSEISRETLEIFYEPSINFDVDDKDCIKDQMFLKLENMQSKEIDAGTSVLGVHRDDIKITTNEKDARIYASQGQQRTVVLSLKMAQTEYIHSIKDEYPILLLDDVMSELDKARRVYLSEKMKDKQVLITCTDADVVHLSDSVKLFEIRSGKIVL
ncbi:MAG: DNA replication/repair protein RecF [Clostridia bacterium]|nr:DNA replication/repair protein RecF [Clostridia bacterium]